MNGRWPIGLAAALAVGACTLGYDADDLTRDRDDDAAGATPSETTYAQAVLADVPAGFYALDEPTGVGVAKDASPNRRDCTYSDAVERGVDGIAGGKAIHLRGSRSYMTCGDAFAFDGERPFAIELWLRVDPRTAFDDIYRRVFSREGTDDGRQQGYYLLFHREERLVVSFARWADNAGKGTFTGVSLDGATLSSTYEHLVVVYGAGEIAFYEQGQKVAQSSSAGRVASGGGPFVLGATSYDIPEGAGVIGDVDALAIYDHELAPDRIALHYRLGAVR